LHWVSGERRNDELFVRLLDKMRRTYRWHKELHLAVDNDSSHMSKRVKEYVEDSGGRVRLHPLPSWSPESNPVELVWWSLHEAVSRNHECEGLEDLVEFAESYLKERQPFRLKLGEVYDRLERPRLEVGRVSIYLVELSSLQGKVGPALMSGVRAGDLLTFLRFIPHASLDYRSDRTRKQLASEPADEESRSATVPQARGKHLLDVVS
jgi:transposase